MTTAEKPINLWRKAFNWLSYLLTAVGVTVLMGTAVIYAYGAYEQYQFERSLAEFKQRPVFQQPVPTAVPPSRPAATAQEPAPEEPAPEPTTIPALSPLPLVALHPERIAIPSIKVDSPVVEALIEDGEWKVPKFVAGHLEGTAKPGETGNGNVALSGHVQSISSGNVFARLQDMRIGDRIILYTQEERFMYQVIESKTVKNTDLSVVQPTPEPIITLITCTGSWLPLARDYSHRLVVIGQMVGVEPLK